MMYVFYLYYISLDSVCNTALIVSGLDLQLIVSFTYDQFVFTVLLTSQTSNTPYGDTYAYVEHQSQRYHIEVITRNFHKTFHLLYDEESHQYRLHLTRLQNYDFFVIIDCVSSADFLFCYRFYCVTTSIQFPFSKVTNNSYTMEIYRK